MGDNEYRFYVSDRLRIHVEIETDHGDVVQFKIQLVARFDDEWRDLARFDNCHGSHPHRHISHADGGDSEHAFVAALPKTFLDHAMKDMKDRAEEWLDEYDRERSNLDRGVR